MNAVLKYLVGEPNFEVVKNCELGKKKTIVISFDGTGGEPQWAVQGKEGEPPLYSGATGLSNICKLHLIAGGNVGNTRKHFEDQVPIYYAGVGTRGSEMGQLIRQVPGFSSGFSMDYIAKMACDDLFKIFEEGDKLFVFGFSRGAATARLFASALDKYPDKKFDYKINFLGVYDTVVESMKYGVSTEIKNMDIGSNSTSKMPDIVERAVHFVAIDEYRGPFEPTLFNADDRVTEIWVPGCHSDIGGGYYHDGISDTVLECMRMEAEKAGLKCRKITADLCRNENNTILDEDSWTDENARAFKEFDKDMKVEPNGLDPDVHDESGTMAYRFYNYMKGFSHRKIQKTKDDKDSGEPILLLDIAVERVKHWQIDDAADLLAYAPNLTTYTKSQKYRPEHLKGIKYKVVSSQDMSISDKEYDIEEQVEW